jgi:hypothetical protein
METFLKNICRICAPYTPLLLATGIVAALCLFGEPLYQGNDDPGLAMVGAGFGEALKPEPFLIWSHLGYGLILVALSRLIGPNAHGWFTVFSVWLSLTLIIRACLSAKNLLVGLSVFMVCFGCIFLTALLAAEFTITAGLLFGAAMAHWLVFSEPDRPQSRLWGLAWVAAFLLAYLIRPESFFMGLLIAAPLIVFLCWRRTKARVRARVLASGLALIVVFGWTEKIAYWSSARWRDAPEYMDLLTQFAMYDRVPYVVQAPEYQQIGWTRNDYDMFGEWYTLDPIFSRANLSFLLERLGKPLFTTSELWGWFRLPCDSWPLLLSLGAQLIICVVLDRLQRVQAILLVLGEIAAIAAVALTGREPLDYVWETAASITLLTLSALLVANPPRKRLLANSGSTMIGFLGIIASALVYADHLAVCHQAADYRRWINQQIGLRHGKVTAWGTGLIWEWLVTPTRIYSPFPELKMAVIDDLGCTPVEEDMLKSLQIDNLAKTLGTDPDMHLICPIRNKQFLVRFCEEHFGISPRFKEEARWEDSAIYSLDQQSGQE